MCIYTIEAHALMNLLSKIGAFMAPFIISLEPFFVASEIATEVICSHRCRPAR